MFSNKLSTYISQVKHKKIWFVFILLGIISSIYIFSVSSPSPSSTSSPPPARKLTVINVSPSEPRTPPSILSFLFNQPIALSQVKAKITPSVPLILLLTTDSSTLLIQSDQPWKLNVEYTITILDQQDNLLYSYQVRFVDPSTINNYPPDQIRPEGI